MLPLDAAISLVLIIALLWTIYGPWQQVCTDFGRQYLFEARDKIFDLAIAGRLDFSSHEYRTIRTSLEKSIRFAHEMTVPRFVIFAAALQWTGNLGKRSELRNAVESISDPETRQQVAALIGEAHQRLVLWMALKSPLFMCGAVIAAILLGISSMGRTDRLSSGVGELIQREVEASPEEVAVQPA
jgi:hypothetical protein